LAELRGAGTRARWLAVGLIMAFMMS
jgi:hypothetical protein